MDERYPEVVTGPVRKSQQRLIFHLPINLTTFKKLDKTLKLNIHTYYKYISIHPWIQNTAKWINMNSIK